MDIETIKHTAEKVKEAVTRNFLLKFFSIAIAVALWSYVGGEKNVQVGLIVPLELRNIPSGYMVTNKVARQVELRVVGPKNLISFLSASETSAFLDLSSGKEGKNIYHLGAQSFNIPRGIIIRDIYPERIEVIFEKQVRKSVPVVVKIKNHKKIESIIESVSVKPSSVLIEGPEVDMKNIERVETELVEPSRLQGEEDIVIPLKVEGRYVRAVGDGMVTVRITFTQ